MPSRARPCQRPAARDTPSPPASLSPRCVPTALMLHLPASRTPLSRKEPRAPSLHTPLPRGCCSIPGVTSRCRRGGDRGGHHGGAPPPPRSSPQGSGTRETCWGVSHQPVPALQRGHTPRGCPCLPADGEDGHLAGMSPGFGGFGGTERWQHLGPLLAAAGTRGRALHRVQVLLVVAGGGKLRQEVQPGEGGNAISVGVVPP